MKNLFRSRVPPTLTPTQINHLAMQSHLPTHDIEEWYERFNHCYPRGYLSYKEFIGYLQQVNIQNGNDNRLTKSLVKRLFLALDLNEDKQLNFEEFFLFNILLNQGSFYDKLKLILSLYDRDKQKYLTHLQLETILTNMFDLLDIPKPANGLSEKIHTILNRAHFNNQNTKISWHTFSSYILNDPSLFEVLISHDVDQNRVENDLNISVTRF